MPQTIRYDFCLLTWLYRNGSWKKVQCPLHAGCFMWCFFFYLILTAIQRQPLSQTSLSLHVPDRFLFLSVPFRTHFSYASSAVCAPMTLAYLDTRYFWICPSELCTHSCTHTDMSNCLVSLNWVSYSYIKLRVWKWTNYILDAILPCPGFVHEHSRLILTTTLFISQRQWERFRTVK